MKKVKRAKKQDNDDKRLARALRTTRVTNGSIHRESCGGGWRVTWKRATY